jgi:hypothetical protein
MQQRQFITEDFLLFFQGFIFNVSVDDTDIDKVFVGNWRWRIKRTEDTSSVNFVSNVDNRLKIINKKLLA